MQKISGHRQGVTALAIPHYEEMFTARITFCDRVEEAIATGTNIDMFRWLRSRSIDPDRVNNVAGLIVETEIAALPGGIFSFSDYGFSAFVITVNDRDAVTPVDFIAWTRDKPNRVYRYFGYADALGVDQLHNPSSYYDGAGLMIHRTPMDWLSAGCAGCVVLDYADFAHRLRALDIPQCRLVGESVIHARAIKNALTPLPDNVRIFVPISQTGATK